MITRQGGATPDVALPRLSAARRRRDTPWLLLRRAAAGIQTARAAERGRRNEVGVVMEVGAGVMKEQAYVYLWW